MATLLQAIGNIVRPILRRDVSARVLLRLAGHRAPLRDELHRNLGRGAASARGRAELGAAHHARHASGHGPRQAVHRRLHRADLAVGRDGGAPARSPARWGYRRELVPVAGAQLAVEPSNHPGRVRDGATNHGRRWHQGPGQQLTAACLPTSPACASAAVSAMSGEPWRNEPGCTKPPPSPPSFRPEPKPVAMPLAPAAIASSLPSGESPPAASTRAVALPLCWPSASDDLQVQRFERARDVGGALVAHALAAARSSARSACARDRAPCRALVSLRARRLALDRGCPRGLLHSRRRRGRDRDPTHQVDGDEAANVIIDNLVGPVEVNGSHGTEVHDEREGSDKRSSPSRPSSSPRRTASGSCAWGGLTGGSTS